MCVFLIRCSKVLTRTLKQSSLPPPLHSAVWLWRQAAQSISSQVPLLILNFHIMLNKNHISFRHVQIPLSLFTLKANWRLTGQSTSHSATSSWPGRPQVPPRRRAWLSTTPWAVIAGYSPIRCYEQTLISFFVLWIPILTICIWSSDYSLHIRPVRHQRAGGVPVVGLGDREDS